MLPQGQGSDIRGHFEVTGHTPSIYVLRLFPVVGYTLRRGQARRVLNVVMNGHQWEDTGQRPTIDPLANWSWCGGGHLITMEMAAIAN